MYALLGIPNIVAATILAVILAIVARKRVFGANERTATSWLDAWLKAIVMVVLTVFLVVYLPSWILTTSTVTGLDRDVQDLLATAVWGAGFGACLITVWYAHRSGRV